jgi:uncharacterized membrane-anchored protein
LCTVTGGTHIDPETPYIKSLSKIKFEEDSECTVFQEKLTNIFVCSLNGKISGLFVAKVFLFP